MATCGVITAAVGTFLPWARIGGRNRSGYDTADTFISLADGALPDAIAWIGRWWYLPAFLVMLAWATTLARGDVALRIVGAVVVALALLMWWIFVWAGDNYGVLKIRLIGPIVTTLGAVIVGVACASKRSSVLARES